MKSLITALAMAASLLAVGSLHAESLAQPEGPGAASLVSPGAAIPGPEAQAATLPAGAAHGVAAQPAAVQAATTPATAPPSAPLADPTTAVPVAAPAAAPAAPVAAVTPAAAAAQVVAPPLVVAQINLSKQRMEVTVDGQPRYSWPVSTARKGYRTPTGNYGVQRMHRRYYSRKYDNAPMPYSIFFNGGYAIHGTTDIRRLGRPASHGCVRLHPNNAAALFALVKEHGSANTRIIVTR